MSATAKKVWIAIGVAVGLYWLGSVANNGGLGGHDVCEGLTGVQMQQCRAGQQAERDYYVERSQG